MAKLTIKLEIIGTATHCVTQQGEACPFLTGYQKGDAGGPITGLFMLHCGGPFNGPRDRYTDLENDANGPRRHSGCLQAEATSVVPHTTHVKTVPEKRQCIVYDPRTFQGLITVGPARRARSSTTWKFRIGI